MYRRLTICGSDANTDVILLNTFQSLTVSEMVSSGNLSIFSLGSVDGVFYAALNFLNSALHANNDLSNQTLLDGSRSLLFMQESEGDFDVVDTFQAVSS